jgi:hypothetical protein
MAKFFGRNVSAVVLILIGFGPVCMANNAGLVVADQSKKLEQIITPQGEAYGHNIVDIVTIATQYIQISALEAKGYGDEPQGIEDGKRILQNAEGNGGVSCETINEQRTNYCVVGDDGSCIADYNDDQTLGNDSDCTYTQPDIMAPAPAPIQVISACVYDVSKDGKVDIADLLQVLATFHTEQCGVRADFNSDCIVDVADLLSLLTALSGDSSESECSMVPIDFWISSISTSPPVDCVGIWSEWSECSAICGTGVQTRAYSLDVQGDFGSQSCPSYSIQSQSCEGYHTATQPCLLAQLAADSENPVTADLLLTLQDAIRSTGNPATIDLPDHNLQLQTAVTYSGTMPDTDGNMWTTYTLWLLPGSDPSGFIPYNVHSIFGTAEHPLVLPPAYQVATAHGGVDVGGIAHDVVTALPSLVQDSWLALGTTDGSVAMSAAGVDFTVWTAADSLTVDAGLVVVLGEPTAGGPGGPAGAATSTSVVVGQLTVPTPADCASAQVTVMNFQGHSQDRSNWVEAADRVDDWQALDVIFRLCGQ